MVFRQFFRKYPKYATTQKEVGETPLVAAERLRVQLGIPNEIPLAYAGRLDPMASGKLLILIGDECKQQTKYHIFDKAYTVEVLFGVSSDTGDVLGLLSHCDAQFVTDAQCIDLMKKLVGTITLPYPHFSSKTVRGKPLHMWTLEGRLNEIDIPVKKSRIHALHFKHLRTITKAEILKAVREKIETIPEVTDPKKALGADFRRVDVRGAWDTFERDGNETYQVLTFTCIASSGTYMRSLAEKIGADLGTCALAYSIHRTDIGRYIPFTTKYGCWIRRF
jgi:tRNA pseudouridine(55) synthase